MSASAKVKSYRARWIVSGSSEPEHNGWVSLRNREIIDVGVNAPPADAWDLGDVALLPGLVNAHTHLEFSDCASPIGAQGMPLAEWIGEVIAARSQTTIPDKQDAIEAGVRESVDAGVRLIGEISTPPFDYDDVSNAAIDLVTFAVVLGLSSARSDERSAAAVTHNEAFSHGGWSPHAPYSTTLSTIENIVHLASRSNRPLAMHVAESPDERTLLEDGTGPFASSLRAIGAWQEGLFPWGRDPFVKLIEMLAAAPLALLIHGNDMRTHEIERVAKHENLTIVYCPRTHAFFGHDKHPVDELMRSGVRVALGTDSKASNPDLNLWREVQFLLKHRQDLAPHDVVQMATINGANAMGKINLGTIEIGKAPGLGVVATNADTIDQLYCDLAEAEYLPIETVTC